MADLGDVRTCGNAIKLLQNMLLFSELEKIEEFKQKNMNIIEDMFKKYNNEIDDMQSIGVLKKPKAGRAKKKKEEPDHRPEAIPEENEDNDEAAHTFVVPPSALPATNVTTVPSEPVVSNGVDGDTTVSGRPRRAAVEAAAEKMKRMTEVANTRKLRRPSDFNQNDHGNYNVYNSTKVDDCFPRTKRRKGSSNETVITSSQFFCSSTLIHSSPINKQLGLSCEKDKSLDMSIIPPHTKTIIELEEHCSIKTRTRTLRNKTEEKVEEAKGRVKKEKENEVDNKQIAASVGKPSDSNSSDDDVALEIRKPEKKSKKEKDDSKEKMSASESESGTRTRTRVQKKPISKMEDLPVVAACSPVKVISDKIKDKVEMFENVVNGTSEESEGRVTRTKTRKMNKSADDEKDKAVGDVFKVPLAVKNAKEMKKPTAVKKLADKTKEPPAVDAKQAAIDERKRLREERAQKAAAARDQAEKEKRENAAKLEKEREEKLKLKRARDEKLKEETERKKREAVAKIEQQRREQEAARIARLQEIMEEENRKEAQRKKEQEMAERKAQQAKLAEKLKAQQKLQAQKKVEAPVELNYSISEDPIPSDEEEESQPKRPIPSWATPCNRNIALKDQIYLAELVPKFFENPADFNPSVIELFGAENVRIRPRTSSAVWNQTVYE